jgi:hypothetical protein
VRFNPLEHPIIFSPLQWLSAASAWTEHAPFGMLLMELAKPKVFVELGTHAGVSYCAFCQAVKQLALPTRCFAIDTWEGDKHSKEYPAEVYDKLREYHDPLYGSFSTLLKKTFDQSVNDFADGSIDLLHIDGLHTYDAVKHDFDTWRSKLSDAAVVLFHDTAETRGDFGVHRLWAEIAPQHRHFNFEHTHGLGVLAYGKNVPAAVLEFIEEANANAPVIRSAFQAIGSRDTLKPIIGTMLGILYQQQIVVNRWRRQTGRKVREDSEDLEMALYKPVGYTRMASNEVLTMLRELAAPPPKPPVIP